jgi:hypothetical protein
VEVAFVSSQPNYSGPYGEQAKQRLESYHPGLADDLDLANKLPPKEVDSLISYLLKLACESQHIAKIQLGRDLLLDLLAELVQARIEELATATLTLDDPWEFRRLLEVYDKMNPALQRRLVKRGIESGNEEVREAAQEFQARNK